jgi:ATP-binding cassette subfamily B protein
VVGETGSGKSTLAALLVRLADPTAGRITVDGVDLRRITAADRARIIGMVTQETYLAHASVAENLRQAAPAATDAELWAALEAAQVDHVIATLPEGLDTVVGARGHRFSGGERQRLAIARTLLVNPPILVLDEATSALDTDTERELQAALDHLMAGRTTLTIAHRLSTVRDADQIVVLDAGRVVEHGRHTDLLAAGGRYASLHG